MAEEVEQLKARRWLYPDRDRMRVEGRIWTKQKALIC
jgi:hypothetical protein